MAKSPASRKPRQKAVPEGETKRAKFERIGGLRMSKALKAIDVLGNLSGSGYEYNETDVRKMRDALGGAVNRTLVRFAPKSEQKKAGFTFTEPQA